MPTCPPPPWTTATPTTITSLRKLIPVLAAVRAQGFAYDDEEWDQGLRCLAVPLTVDGTALAALSVSGAAGEFSDDVRPGFLDLLRDTAASLSEDRTIVAALTAAPSPRG